MPLFVPIIFTSIVAGLVSKGVKEGYDGFCKFKEAKKILDKAKEDYERNYFLTSKEIESFIQNELAKLGQEKIEANELRLKVCETLKRGIKTIKNIKISEINFENEDLNIPEIENYVLNEEPQIIEGMAFIKDTIKAGKSVQLAYIAATGLARNIGIASTGTAIRSLSGVAARNAMLAWFGGGALSAGGGGIALGTLVLSGITVAPSILLLGLTVKKIVKDL